MTHTPCARRLTKVSDTGRLMSHWAQPPPNVCQDLQVHHVQNVTEDSGWLATSVLDYSQRSLIKLLLHFLQCQVTVLDRKKNECPSNMNNSKSLWFIFASSCPKQLYTAASAVVLKRRNKSCTSIFMIQALTELGEVRSVCSLVAQVHHF